MVDLVSRNERVEKERSIYKLDSLYINAHLASCLASNTPLTRADLYENRIQERQSTEYKEYFCSLEIF